MPGIEKVVETGVYAEDLEAAERFYTEVLGLPLHSKEEGRHVFFRVGGGHMLLIFNPHATSQENLLPAHGTSGPGHFALGIASADLQAWRERLAEKGVAIEKEITWPRGGTSLYFRDPAGNSVELITPAVWGTPEGW